MSASSSYPITPLAISNNSTVFNHLTISSTRTIPSTSKSTAANMAHTSSNPTQRTLNWVLSQRALRRESPATPEQPGTPSSRTMSEQPRTPSSPTPELVVASFGFLPTLDIPELLEVIFLIEPVGAEEHLGGNTNANANANANPQGTANRDDETIELYVYGLTPNCSDTGPDFCHETTTRGELPPMTRLGTFKLDDESLFLDTVEEALIDLLRWMTSGKWDGKLYKVRDKFVERMLGL
ncbi:hypothetical protein BJY00DRAFT_319202 [Aspergillus carlsbadensis]|nr:hypothetical protein BJY00DRAFT_319202 [Aspergillus carlsbadensis]